MQRTGVPGGLERIIDSATSNISDGLNWICLFTVNSMRRAQILCYFQTRGHDVNGDDGCCSDTRAAMIAEHPTAPAPKEAKLVPGLTLSAFITAPAPV